MRFIARLLFVFLVLPMSACEVINQSLSAKPAPVVENSYEQQLRESERLAREEAKSSMAVLNTSDEETLLTLMRYSRFITDLTKPDVEREYKKIQTLNRNDPSVRSQFKLAMLLSLPQEQFHDAKLARQILIEFIEGSSDHAPTLREYAFVLLESIDKKAKLMQSTLNLQRRLRQETQRRKQLENQLEALKSIEQSISQRQEKPEEVQ